LGNGSLLKKKMEYKVFDIVTDLIREDITKQEAIDKLLVLYSVINWVAFDWMKIETRPTKYGKYLITRKDGKIHWETWNGSGWAYNHNEIRYWAEIKPPCL
jgi:hypothetical protein